MNLYWFSGESGLREWIFADTYERASELYAEVVIMSGAPPSRYWGREITEDALVGRYREHYLAAAASDQEGFGDLDRRRGWSIMCLADRIERL